MIQVKPAATVICLRCRHQLLATKLTRHELLGQTTKARDPSATAALFGPKLEEVYFESGWEILMAQREVKNWCKSSPEKDVTMRYPGEWNFAGGSVEPAESLEQAARRELEEEFLLELPAKIRLRLISVKQTRAIRATSNVMYNFVALADDPENGWLRDLDVEATNAGLSKRREEHQRLVSSGEFWKLTSAEKESVAPEIRQLRWLAVPQAVAMSFTSMIGPPLVPVDEWQRTEFERYGVAQRDFTWVVMSTCLDMEAFPSAAALIRHTLLDPEAELTRIQWLFPCMTTEEAERIFWSRVGDTSRFHTADGTPSWLALRRERVREDERHAAMSMNPVTSSL
eukprot:gnl/TRDRNA2_/TRDRNA2_169647_c0_seq2.p1 gnl/TRDRNA2_/TRDRNA2_169647_c0~~gnl/TRDRNA2_/TRDRNA2_169647_c0_seq2.p1  ORF type:complete len:341 (-),score=71.87 gnl/TRDRNA2_/TRDRNA2_169647_c0_seq2:141-1163(-)